MSDTDTCGCPCPAEPLCRQLAHAYSDAPSPCWPEYQGPKPRKLGPLQTQVLDYLRNYGELSHGQLVDLTGRAPGAISVTLKTLMRYELVAFRATDGCRRLPRSFYRAVG